MADFTNGSFDTNLSSWIAGKKPTDVSGIKLWYDISQLTSLNDGDDVTTVIDYSGSGLNMTQSVANNKGHYKTNILNGKPVLRTDPNSGNQVFYTNTTGIGAQGNNKWCTLIVARPQEEQETLFIKWGLNASNKVVNNQLGSSNRQTSYMSGFFEHSAAYDADNWYIFGYGYDQSYSRTTLNGASSTALACTSRDIYAGSACLFTYNDSSAGGNPYGSDVAEIMMFTDYPSAADRADLNSYLALKYAITISSIGANCTRDTGVKYAGAASMKVVAINDTAVYENLIPAEGSRRLVFYAYTDGSAVTSADVAAFYDGAELTSTYTDMGSGWYKVDVLFTGAATAKNIGAKVKAGKTVYLDSFSNETGNVAPNTPTNSTPANAATNQSRQLTLTGSAYSDTESDAHTASQWQVATDSGFTSVVWDSGETADNKTSVVVNSSNGTFAGALSGKSRLGANTTYYWRVKYKD